MGGMPIATVTSKGQITIPLPVRASLGLEAGTRVEFVPRPDGGYDFVPLTGSITDLAGALARPGSAVSLEQMEEAITAGARDAARS